MYYLLVKPACYPVVKNEKDTLGFLLSGYTIEYSGQEQECNELLELRMESLIENTD